MTCIFLDVAVEELQHCQHLQVWKRAGTVIMRPLWCKGTEAEGD